MSKSTTRNTGRRRERIMQLLMGQGRVQVTELALRLGVSTVTIRGDLNAFEALGLVERSYGGASLKRRPPQEHSMRQKEGLNATLKERIGGRAAKMVASGDNIIIDSGTTTMALAHHLRAQRKLTVMTNGLNIAWALADADGVELMLTGGLLRKTSLSVLGSQAEACLGGYNFDKLFLGADGCDLQFGLTTHHEAEARLNQMMVERAKKVIVLCDSSKFGRVSLHRIMPLERVHTLITDTGISDEYRDGLLRMGIELITVE